MRPKTALDLSRWESPSKRASFLVQRMISPNLAMLDDSYQLSNLIFQLDPEWRPGVKGPYHDVWKMGQTDAGGQTWLWHRIEHDQRLSDHARTVWHELFPPFPIDDKLPAAQNLFSRRVLISLMPAQRSSPTPTCASWLRAHPCCT
ncbi:hypothetical protein [Tunturiibacter lichenicola]|uniref:hypothetical protein n=1 Tax=Tunturiibacter lichenicola TaxID=2051959 RepID=UPI003D9B836A